MATETCNAQDILWYLYWVHHGWARKNFQNNGSQKVGDRGANEGGVGV